MSTIMTNNFNCEDREGTPDGLCPKAVVGEGIPSEALTPYVHRADRLLYSPAGSTLLWKPIPVISGILPRYPRQSNPGAPKLRVQYYPATSLHFLIFFTRTSQQCLLALGVLRSTTPTAYST